MRDDLLQYYEKELIYIRQAARLFAEKYPRVAQRLALEEAACKDPHVERLIESFAFLAARIHLKLDDEFPEISESLLQVLYPHYLAPIPSMSVAQFMLNPEIGKLTSGLAIRRHSQLYSGPSRLEGTRCRFRTAYPVTLWPVEVSSARLDREDQVLTLKLNTFSEASFKELEIDSLRFFIHGSDQVAYPLYEAILRTCRRVELHCPQEGGAGNDPIVLAEACLRPVGFEPDEGMLPYSSRSFLGYRLLQEYFYFPEKFLFFEIDGLSGLRVSGRFDREIEIRFLLREAPHLHEDPDSRHFRLGCSPIVNLFEQTAEPIRLTQSRTQYRVIPEVARQFTTEVYSVDGVHSVDPRNGATVDYQPFYSFKHSHEGDGDETFWHAQRKASERRGDLGTEVFLTLVDLGFRRHAPANANSLIVRITATNRDLPGKLPFLDPQGDLDLVGGAPIQKVRCLVKPTETCRPPLRQKVQWRLISHLSLNYLSLVGRDQGGDPEALREILKLYDFEDSRAIRQQINGIVHVQGRQVIRRLPLDNGTGFIRGMEATVEFDESRYAGTGIYLFASVLERFLGLYVSINSFSQLVAKSTQRGELKQWKPRAGSQILL